MRIRKVGPSEVVLITRIEARLLDELRCPLLSIEQIAARIGVTDDTAENVVRKLKKQLKARTRNDIVTWWERQRVRYAR